MPERLIPRFTHRQLEAIVSIPVDPHPELEARFELKALTHDASLIERLWWDQGTGQAIVQQANITDHQWRIVPHFWYSTMPKQIPLLLTLVGDTAEQYAEMIEKLLSGSLFQNSHWARVVTATPERDCWLVEDEPDSPEASHSDAIAAWRAGSQLPRGYYRFDRDAAARVIENGIIQHGRQFLEAATERVLDESLQMALLGDIVYD